MTVYSIRKAIILMIMTVLLPPLILFTCDGLVNAQGPTTQLGADIDGEAADDWSGISVSLNTAGDIVAVGAFWNDGYDGTDTDAGHVRVYQYQSGTDIWAQLGADIDGEAADDHSGRSISLNAAGDIIAIGAPYNDGTDTDAGHVRVYQYQSGIWTQLGADIDGEAANDYSGTSVSLNAAGDIVAIGADGNDGNDGSGTEVGHVRVYQYQSGTDTWAQLGADIDGGAADDYSGWSVSLNAVGDIVAIGAYGNDGNGSEAGHVTVYQYQSGTDTWVPLGADIEGEAAGDYSGASVSLNAAGDIVAIGADWNDGFDGTDTDAGHVRVYQYQSGTDIWAQLGADIDGEAADDHSGFSVSLNAAGDIIAIGAYGNDGYDGADTDAGHTRVYQYQSGTDTWAQLGVGIDGEAAGDYSGASVSLNAAGDIAAIGAPRNGGNGSEAGHVRVFGLPVPEIAVLGTGVTIAAGDTSPNTVDNTDFGSLTVGDSPIIHTFTISNSGTLDLILSGSPAITLTSGTHFSVSTQPVSTTVISNSTTTFEVTFNPSVGGSFTDTVNIANNDSDENPYTFVISGTGVILPVNLSVSTSSGSEAAETEVTVTATAPDNVVGNQTVDLDVSGTGITAGDYSLSNTSITIPNGQISGSVIFTVQNDTLIENNEIATLTISNPSAGLTLGTTTSQDVAIADNDVQYTVAANAASLTEGDTGSTPIAFTITRSGGYTDTSGTVSFSLGGTADSGSDYHNVMASPILFAVGEISQTVTMDVLGDWVDENSEVISVTLTDPTVSNNGTASLGAATSQTTINDDDSAAITVDPVSGLVTNESGLTATFTIVLASQPTNAVVIDLSSSDPAEGTISPASVSFTTLNWNIPQTVTITGVDDGISADGDQNYTIQLTMDSTTAATEYGALDPDDVSVVNRDNNMQPVFLPLIIKN